MTKQTLTPFNQLSEDAKAERLARYEAERERRGTVEKLANVVKEPVFYETSNPNRMMCVTRLVSYDKETKSREYYDVTTFMNVNADGLRGYYESLKKGQLVSVEYRVRGQYRNVYRMMNRVARQQAEVAYA